MKIYNLQTVNHLSNIHIFLITNILLLLNFHRTYIDEMGESILHMFLAGKNLEITKSYWDKICNNTHKWEHAINFCLQYDKTNKFEIFKKSIDESQLVNIESLVSDMSKNFF